ncbi:MAG: SprT-like family [Phycisphaerales bacterium]|nr:SprT-like family [Phycisphaerales bacterium]
MARPVRIEGLVRAANAVRRELVGPVTADRRERLKTAVEENLRKVQEILRANRARLEHLPAPSQRAYRFLAGVDWAEVETSRPVAGQTPPPPVTSVSWRGLSNFVNRTLDQLAADLTAVERTHIVAAIARTSRQIEMSIDRRKIPPDRLTPATRDLRGWVAYLSREENLAGYVRARSTAGGMLDAAAASSRHYPPPLTIHFRPMTGIYKLRPSRRGPVLWLPTPMILFDTSAFTALAELVFDRSRDAKQRVIREMTGEGYQALRAELDALGGTVDLTRGAAHDLSASFDRVNAAYFGGKMARPRLTWNRTFTGRKFGHYDWILDTVMVSRTLDSADVPAFVVDFLVFHELLHKFHGLHWVNGRGYAHTTEFQQSELKFTRFHEAEAILQKLAKESRGTRMEDGR